MILRSTWRLWRHLSLCFLKARSSTLVNLFGLPPGLLASKIGFHGGALDRDALVAERAGVAAAVARHGARGCRRGKWLWLWLQEKPLVPAAYSGSKVFHALLAQSRYKIMSADARSKLFSWLTAKRCEKHWPSDVNLFSISLLMLPLWLHADDMYFLKAC